MWVKQAGKTIHVSTWMHIDDLEKDTQTTGDKGKRETFFFIAYPSQLCNIWTLLKKIWNIWMREKNSLHPPAIKASFL